MRKILLTGLLLFLVSSVLMAQGTKKKKTKHKEPPKEEVVEVAASEDMAVQDVLYVAPTVAMESESSSSGSGPFKPVKNIRYDNNYETYDNINDQYDFYCEKGVRDRSSKLGIVDKNGKVILPHIFGKVYATSRKFEVSLCYDSNYGLFNLNDMRWSIPLMYDELKGLGNSLFAVKKDGKWGVVDSNNNTILPFSWSEVSSISNLDGYLRVGVNGYPNETYGVYSLLERKLVIPCVYSNLYLLDNQNYFYVYSGDKYNIVDINNKPQFTTWYDEITVSSKGPGFFIVKKDGKYGVIDEKEKVIIPMEYQDFGRYPYSDGSYLAKNKEGKYGFITIDGRVTLPFQYDNLKKGDYDNMISMQNGKCGLVQVNSGVPYELTTCDYDDIKGDSKIFVVQKNGKFGLVDAFGRMILEAKYLSLESLDKRSSNGALYVAKSDKGYELINDQGKQITKNAYPSLSMVPKASRPGYYDPKFSFIKAQAKNGKYVIIDKIGVEMTEPIFEDVVSENDYMFVVKSKGKYGIYSLLTKKMVVDFEYELIIFGGDKFCGINGKKITFLAIQSGVVTKIETVK